MHLAIAGSVATDHLQVFNGKFADSLVPDQLDKLSVSFLVDELLVRRGGCAANIAFGLGVLGHQPTLVASVGADFAGRGYQEWLEQHGVDCSRVRVSETAHTALCTITTDSAHAQIVSFYPGAMAEAQHIDIADLHSERPIDLLLIGPDDPAAMKRHTTTAREIGIDFAADPSQQLAFNDGELIRDLIDGATYLFSNDYEDAMIQSKTGWTADQVQSRVQIRVVTRGAHGVTVYGADGEVIDVPAVNGVEAVDPTGVGDSFRAGFLSAIAAGLDLRTAAQVGCTIAASVVETTGTQEYTINSDTFLKRLEDSYGLSARSEVSKSLQF